MAKRKINDGVQRRIQFKGTLEDAQEKCKSALIEGGFKSIKNNENKSLWEAKYSHLITKGSISIWLLEVNQNVEVHVKSIRSSANIFARLSFSNDNIINAFVKHFQ